MTKSTKRMTDFVLIWLVIISTCMTNLSIFRSVTYGPYGAFIIISDLPGAAMLKRRPEKSEFSGLMNPCRGEAAGMNFYHEVQM